MKRLKISFYSGLITILPIIITIYILNWIFQILFNILHESFLTKIIKAIVLKIGKEQDIRFYTDILINILSFLTAIFIVIAIGMAMRVFIFKKIGTLINRMLIKIPLFSQIYSTIAQIIALFSSDREKNYQKVVMLEYPRKGIYSLGFMTSDENYILKDEIEEEVCNIFIPTSPNPTSGMFVMVKKEEVKVLDIKIDDAIKLIISGGVILPPKK